MHACTCVYCMHACMRARCVCMRMCLCVRWVCVGVRRSVAKIFVVHPTQGRSFISEHTIAFPCARTCQRHVPGKKQISCQDAHGSGRPPWPSMSERRLTSRCFFWPPRTLRTCHLRPRSAPGVAPASASAAAAAAVARRPRTEDAAVAARPLTAAASAPDAEPVAATIAS